jgi:hypothetical protein
VCDVPGRSDILFHVGNTGADTEGCICPGFGFEGRAVRGSLDALERLERFLKRRRTFTLVVRDPAA